MSLLCHFSNHAKVELRNQKIHDRSRGLVLFQVALVIILLFSTFGASSHVNVLATPIPSPGSPGCYVDDRCTLLTFKKGLFNEGEPALASWSISADVSHWKGVSWKTAAAGIPYAYKLELGDFKLNGTRIAPLLQYGLTNLTTLNISGNFISARLPDPLRICPSLLVLDISNNSFGGSLPQLVSCDDTLNGSAHLTPVAFSSTNLRVLNISRNNFLGEVPGSLFSSRLSGGRGGSLSNLTSLVLEENYFEGSFPSDSIGNCTDLVQLKLSNNNFAGPFPLDALQKLKKLEIVEATSSGITGDLQIPNDGLSFGQLKSLSLSYNSLTGNIPESLGNFSNLESLELQYNNLSGNIPKTLAKLSKLKILSLEWNHLNGNIPEEIFQLSNLETLSLNHNKLRGSLSPNLSNCTNLKSFWLNENSISGTVPAELGNLTNLVVVSLYGNYFSQSIPPELGRLRTLMAFDLSYNNLGGNIPDVLCDLFQLQVLLFDYNRLTGSVPNCFGNFTYLRLLGVSSNFLTGHLPADLSNISMNVQSLSEAPDELSSATYIQELEGQNLVFLYTQSPISYHLANNFFSGQIPETFGDIQNLQLLRLDHNNFSGPIPKALGNASALMVLDLSSNELSNVIPYSLTELHFLSAVNFSYNNLSGQIPQASQFLTFSPGSFYGNPFLCGIPLELKCLSLQQEPPPTSAPASTHASFKIDEWISFPAFGAGVAISFSIVTSFALPFAYLSGKRVAKAQRIVPERRELYGVFRFPS